MRPLAWFLALAGAAGAQTMDVHVRQSGAFQSRPDGFGVITGVVDLRTTVQFPESRTPHQRTVVIGGNTRGTAGTSSSASGPLGHSSTMSNGGGNLVSVTVTPVPVITGPRAYALEGATSHQLVALLDGGSADDRLSALAEIGRRRWTPRARTALTRRVSSRLADTSPTVAGAAARCLADLGDPEAQGHLLGYLRGREPDRVVPLLEALGRAGDARAKPQLAKMADSIDLQISRAASRALTAIERRAHSAAARSDSSGTNR